MGDPRLARVVPPSGPIGTRPSGSLPDDYARLGAALQRVGLPPETVQALLTQVRTIVDTAVVHAIDRVASTVVDNQHERAKGLRAALHTVPSFAGLARLDSIRGVIDTYHPDRAL